MDWTEVVAALFGGGVIQIISLIVNHYTKKKELIITDESQIRTSLQKQIDSMITERTGFVEELEKLTTRVERIEEEKQKLQKQVVDLQKAAFERERALLQKIDAINISSRVREQDLLHQIQQLVCDKEGE